jgi:hypothetical protein
MGPRGAGTPSSVQGDAPSAGTYRDQRRGVARSGGTIEASQIESRKAFRIEEAVNLEDFAARNRKPHQHGGPPVGHHDNPRDHFSEEELVNLTIAVIATNGWNRLNIAFRPEVGDYRPGMFDLPKTPQTAL